MPWMALGRVSDVRNAHRESRRGKRRAAARGSEPPASASEHRVLPLCQTGNSINEAPTFLNSCIRLLVVLRLVRFVLEKTGQGRVARYLAYAPRRPSGKRFFEATMSSALAALNTGHSWPPAYVWKSRWQGYGVDQAELQERAWLCRAVQPGFFIYLACV